MVRRLPEPLEWVFMTPSHHRVHHDRRVHKNFGGLLIIWDRLFGSFQDEYETVRPLQAQSASAKGTRLPQEEVMLFGAATQVRTWTEPVTQTQFWSPIIRALGGSAGTGVGGWLQGLVKAAVVGPGFYTTGAKRDLKPPSSSARRIRNKSALPLAGQLYVLAAFLGIAVSTGLLVLLFASAPWPLRALGGGVTLWALYCQGLLLDARGRQGWRAEGLRAACSLALAVLLLHWRAGPLPDGTPRTAPALDVRYETLLASAFMRKFLLAMAVSPRPTCPLSPSTQPPAWPPCRGRVPLAQTCLAL